MTSTVGWDDVGESLAASLHIANQPDFVDPVHFQVAVAVLDVLYPLFQFFNPECRYLLVMHVFPMILSSKPPETSTIALFASIAYF
jgi:hypothetical protein